jgi:hypothetical protein
METIFKKYLSLEIGLVNCTYNIYKYISYILPSYFQYRLLLILIFMGVENCTTPYVGS